MKVKIDFLFLFSVFIIALFILAPEIKPLKAKFELSKKEAAEEDYVVNYLESTDAEGEKFLGKDDAMFTKALEMVVKVFKQQGIDLNTVRGITQTSGFVFVAFDNGDYKRMGEFGQFKEGLMK